MQITTDMLSSIPFQYAQQVRAGEIVVGSQIRLAVERFYKWIEQADERGFILDHQEGLDAIDFFPMFLQHTKGPLAKIRAPFLLSPYQQFSVYNAFGWKIKETGLRRVRKVYEKEARKNGKSAKIAGVGLYCQGFDGEQSAEIYVAATIEKQAKIIWEQASDFVYKSLPLRSLGFQTTLREIRLKRLMSVFRYQGGDSKTQDGLNPSAVFIDEYHAHMDDGVLEVLESGMGARDQPIVWIITTAGFNIMSPCKHFEDVCKEILDPENEKEDDYLWIMIHELDETDNWEDESVWEKANPNIRYNPPLLDFIRKEYIKAKNQPSKIPNFQTKHLNMWVDAPRIWVPTEVWDRNAVKNIPLVKFQEFGAYAGLDLSTTTDLTAFVVLSEPDQDGVRYLVPFIFCPEDTIARRSREDGVQYKRWCDEKWIIATSGEVIDYNEVEHYVRRNMQRFNVKRIEIDRFNSTGITTNLMASGLNVAYFSQTVWHYNAPTKEFERLLYLNKIKHNGNPVMKWMLTGCVVKQDANENVRLDKGKSHAHGKRIDGIVASIMALGGSLSPPEETNESRYNNPENKIYI